MIKLAKCEFEDGRCYMPTMKICTEMCELCKRRKLLRKGMTQEQIDELLKVPEKYRVR